MFVLRRLFEKYQHLLDRKLLKRVRDKEELSLRSVLEGVETEKKEKLDSKNIPF